MAHIHLPDGTFSLLWVLIWWGVALVLIALALRSARSQTIETKRLAIAGMIAAASFAVFQINIPFAGGVHMNLTPLIGILTGPAIGSLVVLVVNILSALVGHGGWGLIGANTTVNISEVITAYYVFKLTKNKLEIFTRGAIAAILGLSVGNVALILIIAISGISGSGVSGSASIIYLAQIPLLNFIVAVGEAVATGYVVLYLSKVRSDLIGD